jgi:SAM-dependent methyltransferase
VGGQADSASFHKPAEAYDRFVGRYAPELAGALVHWAGIGPGSRVLDVGCGPGALTAALAGAVEAGSVAAVDPSEPFARACAERVPEADVRVASAERLPFEDRAFDATLSQLVLNFLADAAAGLREMRRVTRPGGTVAAAVWDYAGEMTMLRAFWDAAAELDPEQARAADEGRRMPHCDPGALARLWAGGGLADVATGAIVIAAAYEDFDELWQPFTAGVGPAGAYCAALPAAGREALRTAYHRRLGSPAGPFELSARAWTVRGTVGP